MATKINKEIRKGTGRDEDSLQQTKGSEFFQFIHNKDDLYQIEKRTYSWCCCEIRPQTDKINQIQVTIVGDILNYDD